MLSDMERYPNKPSWALNIKHLLGSLGFNYAWIYQSVGNTEHFLSLCKQRLTDQFIQAWNNEISTSTRADSYRLFSDFGFKSYLETVNIQKFRQALTRLRVSSHRLEIETGRWHKPHKIPRNERKCQFCNSLEDEFHFLLECSLYTNLRKRYIKPYYWRNPNIVKFIELMQLESEVLVKDLAVYVQKSFEKRDVNIYLEAT